MQMTLGQTLKKGASISDMLYSGEDDAQDIIVQQPDQWWENTEEESN